MLEAPKITAPPKARIKLPPKLVPVFTGKADYRGAYGGRGSAKTRSFAKMAAVFGYRAAMAKKSGVIVCGREFMNSLADSSLSEVKAAIASEKWLADFYDVGEKYIRTRDGYVSFAFVGLSKRAIDSIKSKSRILILWVDEAEPVSATAWSVAINTVREIGSEIWVTWNPERKKSATHMRFRENPPKRSKIIQLNWRDNIWFPASLNRKRLEDQEKRPDSYEHVWEGDFVTVNEGAYYASLLANAKRENRITLVKPDPMFATRAFFDIGGTGARADAVAIWIKQWIGLTIRVLDYYEAVGQPLETHVAWLREHGYGNAEIYLPHDGVQGDKVYAASYEGYLRAAGFSVTVVPNQGTGAAKQRIEAGRRLLPRCYFNEATTEAGREALAWYHEKRSEDDRNIGLGPNHDWSSHAGDSFGMGCIIYEEPTVNAPRERKRNPGGVWA
jgi:phage terminase large subunit